MKPPPDVDAYLALPEEEFARQCKFEAFRSGGPGGQKRNKSASAVKLTHLPTGVEAFSSDFRSQAQNRVRALHRLRFKLATERRQAMDRRGYEPPPWFSAARVQSKLTTNTKNPLYARLAAHVLDVLAAVDGRVADAAALLGVPSSNLVRFLKAEHSVWAVASRIRQSRVAVR